MQIVSTNQISSISSDKIKLQFLYRNVNAAIQQPTQLATVTISGRRVKLVPSTVHSATHIFYRFDVKSTQVPCNKLEQRNT